MPNAAEPINKEKFIEFLTQACTGPIMALVRMPHVLEQISAEAYGMVIRQFFARYLNDCWSSLLADTDPYVTEMFTDINHHSPVCLINALFAVGTKILPTEPIPFGSTGSGQVAVDMQRNMLSYIFRESITKVLDDNDLLNHECHGKTLAEEREEWVNSGKPNVEFFTFRQGEQRDEAEQEKPAEEEKTAEEGDEAKAAEKGDKDDKDDKE